MLVRWGVKGAYPGGSGGFVWGFREALPTLRLLLHRSGSGSGRHWRTRCIGQLLETLKLRLRTVAAAAAVPDGTTPGCKRPSDWPAGNAARLMRPIDGDLTKRAPSAACRGLVEPLVEREGLGGMVEGEGGVKW